MIGLRQFLFDSFMNNTKKIRESIITCMKKDIYLGKRNIEICKVNFS